MEESAAVGALFLSDRTPDLHSLRIIGASILEFFGGCKMRSPVKVTVISRAIANVFCTGADLKMSSQTYYSSNYVTFSEDRVMLPSCPGDPRKTLNEIISEKHIDAIAAPETWDNEKPYMTAKIEIPTMVRLMRYYAGWASWVEKLYGIIVLADSPHHVQVLYEPIGVTRQIIPWNFPHLMFAWKVGPTLACGNTIVLKHAEQTPLYALFVCVKVTS